MSAATGSYSAASGSSSANARQQEPSSRWIFTEEQLLNVPSIKEGMHPEEELRLRRSAAHTIHQMADRLNHESRVRISQLCICAAMMHMHRFFVFHSFNKFDPRDIAAACLFLAGKSEECPRKLEHVVRVWWAVKFPFAPTLDNNRYHDAAQLIVTLENVVLQTIAFDLTVDIPHPYVLKQMQDFTKGNRRLSEIAYWFASDMLHMTNWGVRFPARAIACVCIQMACSWAEFEIQLPPGSKPWYELVDPNMTHDKLIELTEEFSQIYRTYGEQLSIRKYVRSSNQQTQRRTHSTSQSQAPPLSLANLPPPPPAPMLNTAAVKADVKAEPARKIDINDYKQRTGAVPNNISSNAQQPPQRRNFMQPDMTQVADLALPPAFVKSTEKRPPGSVDLEAVQNQKRRLEGTEKDATKHRRPEGQEKEKHRRSDLVDKEMLKHRRSEDLNSHHRKRPHERNSISQEQPASASTSGTAQYSSVPPPREPAVVLKKARPTPVPGDLNSSAPANLLQNASNIPLPSSSGVNKPAVSNSSYSVSQQHRVSSRSADGQHRISEVTARIAASAHLATSEARNPARTASPGTSSSSASQRQHPSAASSTSSRTRTRDVNTASIPLPPGDGVNGGHTNSNMVNSNSTFAQYAKRPQRQISPPPPPANRTSNFSSRVMLPPPPAPPQNDELEDGEVL